MYEWDDTASAHVVGSPVAPPSAVAPSPTRLPELEPLPEPPELDDAPSPLPPPSGLAKPSSVLLPLPQAPMMTVQPSAKQRIEKVPRMGET
jgi:hypothetical protein